MSETPNGMQEEKKTDDTEKKGLLGDASSSCLISPKRSSSRQTNKEYDDPTATPSETEERGAAERAQYPSGTETEGKRQEAESPLRRNGEFGWGPKRCVGRGSILLCR